jgi:hypothetical protein
LFGRDLADLMDHAAGPRPWGGVVGRLRVGRILHCVSAAQ